MPLAIGIGYFAYKKGANLTVLSIVALTIMYITIYIGTLFPVTVPGFIVNPVITWAVILMIYAYIASILR